MLAARLSATALAFVVFLAGIGLGALAYPFLRAAIPDDRVLALAMLAYLLLLRLLGRKLARKLARDH